MMRPIGVLALGAMIACTEPDSVTPLPATQDMRTSAGMLVPTGDFAGPRDRGAEQIRNPYEADPMARVDGQRLYREMNCMYCHGASGEGGMGPNLVDSEWLFGDTPVDRFMSVYGGRARGMPAYGHMLPDESVWKIVTYVEHLGSTKGEPRRAGGGGAEDTRRSQEPRGGRH